MIAPLVAALLAAPAAAAPALSLPVASVRVDDVERATEWPEPMSSEALTQAVAKVRKARNDEMAAAGHAELTAIGAAAAPKLLLALSREKKDDPRARLISALDAVTAATHTRLLAEELESKSPALRGYVARRIATLGDPGLRERAEQLLAARLSAAEDERKARKLDPDDLPCAAVLAMATGSPAGVDRALLLASPKEWAAWKGVLEAAAAQARGAGSDVASHLVGALGRAEDAHARVSALRLLTYAGGKDHARAVAPCLDAEENHVKITAINALRRMVDGDPPLKALSTFDAIERANQWKRRL